MFYSKHNTNLGNYDSVGIATSYFAGNNYKPAPYRVSKFMNRVFSKFLTSRHPSKSVRLRNSLTEGSLCGNHSCRRQLSEFPVKLQRSLYKAPIKALTGPKEHQCGLQTVPPTVHNYYCVYRKCKSPCTLPTVVIQGGC
jgi:hypothetical protein